MFNEILDTDIEPAVQPEPQATVFDLQTTVNMVNDFQAIGIFNQLKSLDRERQMDEFSVKAIVNSEFDGKKKARQSRKQQEADMVPPPRQQASW